VSGFSVIVCTYNPNPEIFRRLLISLEFIFLKKDIFEKELIIVDNNSTDKLKVENYRSGFQLLFAKTTIIYEGKPGLTAARLAGIKAAKFERIVFFDDDNEPDEDYLLNAALLFNELPEVSAWGPGKVGVEYTDSSGEWLNNFREVFQERNEKQRLFANSVEWQNCYPFGTGLCVDAVVAKKYQAEVLQGKYTLNDRKGKSLSSGGDTQLILTAVKSGCSVGVAPELKLKHLIDGNKATLKYMQKQQYGTASAYIKARNQVFEASEETITDVSNAQVLKMLYSIYRIHFNKSDYKRVLLLIATRLGEINARIVAYNLPKPLLLRGYEKLIGYS